jgi:hypothetical protein
LRLEEAAGGGGLREALRLHYRLRFDPRGLASEERERLRELVVMNLRENHASD